jgi:uncharacterized protein YceH (UPF0502 family)
MTLDIRLDPNEARVFGVLIEKALTTPEQYPLTVNAATNGANQKSNRDPVLSLSEDEVASALERLEQKYMARKVFPMNSRVEKYCHNGKDALAVDAPELAVLAELLMRGPQTPGELRARAGRMTPIESLDQLMTILAHLIDRNLARRLPPAPGSRAERYAQLLSPDLHPLEAPAGAYAGVAERVAEAAATPVADLVARVAALESEVTRLRAQLHALADKLGHGLDG